MIEKYDIYYYNGFYLNSDSLNRINVNVIRGDGLISLLDCCDKVYIFKDLKLIDIDINMFKSVIMSSNKYYYRLKNNILTIFPFKIYYGIMASNELCAVYDDEGIRNNKFDIALKDSLFPIIDDMNSCKTVINEYNKQMVLKKIYDGLSDV